MINKSHFVNVGQGSVFHCRICWRRTRHVDQAIGSGLCPQCEEICGYDNSVNDNHFVPGSDEYGFALTVCEDLLAVIVKRGGDAKAVKAANTFIWPKAES